MDRKYVFVKDWKTSGGVIPQGSDLTLTHGCVYFNGGLMDTFYQRELFNLLEKERKQHIAKQPFPKALLQRVL